MLLSSLARASSISYSKQQTFEFVFPGKHALDGAETFFKSDMQGLALRSHDNGGASVALKAGRNFVPVSAYKSGTVQFDFEGKDAPTAVIQPASSSYHLNKGGVQYRHVTVMGRLVDQEGSAIKGAHMINHAGRSVTEADGFFAVEMSASTPTLEIRHQSITAACGVTFDAQQHRQEAGTLLVGDVTCPTTLTEAPAALTNDSQS